MLGYTVQDVGDMIEAIDLAKGAFDTDEDQWIYNNLDRAQAFLEGLLATGHVS